MPDPTLSTSLRRLVAAVAGAATAATLGLAYAAVPASAAPGTPVEVVCDGLGAVTLTVTRAAGSVRASTADPGTTVVGGPGFTGADDAGRPVEVAAPTGAGLVRCEAPRAVDVPLADVVGEPAARTSADEPVTGTQTWTLRVAASAATTAAARTGALPSALVADLAAYLRTRGGDVQVAVRPLGGTSPLGWTRGRTVNETASIVKVQVMAAVMRRAQEQGRGLTTWERGQIVPMIRVSDNAATTRLWDDLGGGRAVAHVNGLLGLTSTRMSSTGAWGRTTTTAADQTVLMGHFALPSSVISETNRAYGLSLMRSIASSQDWGVTAGPPARSTALKNGWVPLSDGWHVNSIGYVAAGRGSYTVGVLTQDGRASMGTLVATIEGVSRIVWRHRGEFTGARGDWTGDGRADALGIVDGTLTLYPGSGDGRLGTPRGIGGGWSTMRHVLTPGDVDGDGRPDLLATTATGDLLFYRGRGAATFDAARKVGTGWSGIDALTSPGDLDGDAVADLLGRTATGTLVRYSVDGAGRVRTVGTVGTGWGGLDLFVGVRDLTGDGRGDVLGTTADGALHLYAALGEGLRHRGQVGSGWGATGSLAAVGDLDGDGVEDLLSITDAGVVMRYPGRLDGRVGSGTSTGVRIAADARII